MSPTLSPWVVALIDAMYSASEADRVDVFDRLKAHFCEHCGDEQTEPPCPCENDE